MWTSENDSLAFDQEAADVFIPSCPWMKIPRKEIAMNTEEGFSNTGRGGVRSRDLNFGFDDAISQYVPGEDFIKTCCFKYVPNKLFNLQIINEDEP